MKILLNPDDEFVKSIREAIIKKQGYCPCKLQKIDNNLCMCKEFRDQIADPNFEVYCHGRLYYKEK